MSKDVLCLELTYQVGGDAKCYITLTEVKHTVTIASSNHSPGFIPNGTENTGPHIDLSTNV